jgi:rhodanese-related sulfurtransferase
MRTDPAVWTRSIEDVLSEARRGLLRLDPHESNAAAREGGLIVDIRADHDRARDGLVPGARIIARNVLEWRFDPDTDYCDPVMIAVTGPLILMCAEGYQSSLAAATLHQIGITNATDMIGGFDAWKAAGLPVTSK